MKCGGSLILFLVLVLGGGLAIGFLTAPGEWYAGLGKPGFNPPNWLFAPVWMVLYVLIAVAGWRVWRTGPRTRCSRSTASPPSAWTNTARTGPRAT